MSDSMKSAKGQKGPWKILIVDDSLVDAIKPFQLVMHIGDHATLCMDGKDALIEAESDQFDLVLLDWSMPQISGSEFLKHLSRGNYSHGEPLRVVIYSGSSIDRNLLPKTSEYVDVIDVWSKTMAPTEILRKIHKIKSAA